MRGGGRRVGGRERQSKGVDQNRDPQAAFLCLLGYRHHLIQRGCNEPRQTKHVCLFLLASIKDLFARAHDAKVDNVIVVASENHANDVLKTTRLDTKSAIR